MDFKKFLTTFKVKNLLSKEARFGVIYYRNDPEQKAILIINNRNALFVDIMVNVMNESKQSYQKKIDQLEARVAMYIGFDELLNNEQKHFEGSIKQIQLHHRNKCFKFQAKENAFNYIGESTN